jgi:SAM-dependent methyltransferase
MISPGRSVSVSGAQYHPECKFEESLLARAACMERKPMAVSTQLEIEAKLGDENLQEWLELWWAEQGPAKRGTVELMASVIPFTPEKRLKVLDLCCGPGDAGRAIHSRFPNLRTDCVDRDLFLFSLCALVNRRDDIPAQTLARDLWNQKWYEGLATNYDVVIVANALHWFSEARLRELLVDAFNLLHAGGIFLLMEPVGPEAVFATGFGKWRNTQPSQHKREDWLRFWTRVNEFLGYDHIKELGNRNDLNRIGDRLSVMGWIAFLNRAGFQSIDVLLRDSEKVVLAAIKP